MGKGGPYTPFCKVDLKIESTQKVGGGGKTTIHNFI